MRNTSKAVCPFHDQEPSAPPPFPPMLTDQLELFSSPRHSTMLITDEILPPKVCTVVCLAPRTESICSRRTCWRLSSSLRHAHPRIAIFPHLTRKLSVESVLVLGHPFPRIPSIRYQTVTCQLRLQVFQKTRRFQSLLVSLVVLGVEDTRSVRLWIGVQRHTPSLRLVTHSTDVCLYVSTPLEFYAPPHRRAPRYDEVCLLPKSYPPEDSPRQSQ